LSLSQIFHGESLAEILTSLDVAFCLQGSQHLSFFILGLAPWTPQRAPIEGAGIPRCVGPKPRSSSTITTVKLTCGVNRMECFCDDVSGQYEVTHILTTTIFAGCFSN
jgi:hypothetical protein